MHDAPTHRRTVDTFRDTAAIGLLLVFPIGQVFATRAAPVAVAFALVCVLAMHLVTKGQVYTPLAERRLHRKPINIVLGVAILWWAISLLWSLESRFALRDIGGIALLFAAVVFLPQQIARTTIMPFASILLAGAAGCAFILLLEVGRVTQLHTMFSASAESFDLNRMALLLVLLLPALGAIIARGGLWMVCATPVFILCVTAAFLSESQSAQFAAIVGLLVLPIAIALPFAGRLTGAAFAALLLFMPLVVNALDTAPVNRSLSSIPAAHGGHRIALWAGYNDLLKQRPLFGWGAGAARYMGTEGIATKIAVERGFPRWTTNPHNAPLEIWTELGFVGAALMSLLMWVIGSTIDKTPKRRRVALTVIFAAATTFSFVSSSLYQGWWLSTLAIGIVSCIAVTCRSAKGQDAILNADLEPVL